MTGTPYRMRVTGPDRAKLFRGRPNQLGRLTWEMVGWVDIATGRFDALAGTTPGPDAAEWCASAAARLRATDPATREIIEAAGRLADDLAGRDAFLPRDLFEILLPVVSGQKRDT